MPINNNINTYVVKKFRFLIIYFVHYIGSNEKENLFNPFNNYDQPAYNQQNSGIKVLLKFICF